jgi:predicted membrane-bound dolichyl-phosphate-mannose-protein mannosyltransferase
MKKIILGTVSRVSDITSKLENTNKSVYIEIEYYFFNKNKKKIQVVVLCFKNKEIYEKYKKIIPKIGSNVDIINKFFVFYTVDLKKLNKFIITEV